jgi:ketosteroid isomerase-like protein
MNAHILLIENFYQAFQRKDYRFMQSCYHQDATFHDPVFLDLSSAQVKAMWEMLLKSSADLRITFNNIRRVDEETICHWEAFYTFTLTGKQVHNRIRGTFRLKDGKILRHIDYFDLWRWCRMAFGMSGVFLGWSPVMRNKIRQKARRRLDDFMKGTKAQ